MLKPMIFSVVLKFINTLCICINIYLTLFKCTWASFKLFSIILVKLRNTFKIGGLITIKSLFSRETETTKVQNLFDLYHMLVHNATMH